MKQKIVCKYYFVSVIKNGKVKEILTGRFLEELMLVVRTKYRDCSTEIAEFLDEYNVNVPEVEEQLLMIRRRQLAFLSK